MAGQGWLAPHRWEVWAQTLWEALVPIATTTPGLKDMKRRGLLQYLLLRRSSAVLASLQQTDHQAVVRHPCSRSPVVADHFGRYCCGRAARGREAPGYLEPSGGPESGVLLRAETGPALPQPCLLAVRIDHS
jgi:hypothetical protein